MNETTKSSAPLAGIKIVEFAGIGPGPFAGMMLADMGAEVIRIERPGDGKPAMAKANSTPKDFLARGRKSLAIDLKSPAASEVALQIIAGSDGLIEGFRPGVMERLGLGPDECLKRNPKLVYGRMTGWGQDGPLAQAAGHDLNYIALTGALWASGEANRAPTFPLNLLGDFGGGGMFLAFGMVTGLLAAARTGKGDVIDAAICDGTSTLMAFIHAQRAMGFWKDQRGANALDGGAPWYNVYECSDGQWITIGAIEPQFWQELLTRLGLDEADFSDRLNPTTWHDMRARFAEIFRTQTRAHWSDLLEGTDACFAPVLSPAEAVDHPHVAARKLFAPDGPDQPMPAPRFEHAQTELPTQAPVPGAQTREVLADAGIAEPEIMRLLNDRVVFTPIP